MRGRATGALLLFVLGGCTPPVRMPHALDTPPVLLVPVERAGVEDGRARFREIYCAVRHAQGQDAGGCDAELLRLDGEPEPAGTPVDLGPPRLRLRVRVVPGLYGDCLPVRAFAHALERVEALGHETGRLEVGGFSPCAANAALLREEILALDGRPPLPLVLVGYSKGVADALEALVAYPEVRERVSALVSVAGVVSGTPLADAVASRRLLSPLIRLSALPCPGRGDPGTLDGLRRSTRLAWLARHPLPDSVRYYSVVAFAERARISHVFRAGYDALARVDPRNDGAVVHSDAVLPGGTLLGFVRADHWAVALPFSRDLPGSAAVGVDRNEFPREALLEAVVRTVEEDLRARRGP